MLGDSVHLEELDFFFFFPALAVPTACGKFPGQELNEELTI